MYLADDARPLPDTSSWGRAAEGAAGGQTPETVTPRSVRAVCTGTGRP